ncbi:MAG: tRNA 2-thiouridine(34) synthase MnmA [Candidatus Paceibacterota bacterium]
MKMITAVPIFNIMENQSKKRVVVGLSGGVDSSVSAALLKQQGYEVIGATMKLWDKNYAASGQKGACYGPGEKDDIEAAQKAANIIGIEHLVIDVSAEYKKYVLEYFKQEYLAGRTPNPCVMCNQKIKFGYLAQKIAEAGVKFDYFATGHYARVIFDKEKNRYLLLRGKDEKKDQAYFLYRLSQEQLSQAIFPLGGYKKEETRKMANELGLQDFANKEESQDFVEGGDYSHIIGPQGQKSGKIIDMDGQIVGEHNGLSNFTIGQRKGLDIGGLSEPYYVISLDVCKNQVTVGKKEDAFSNEFEIGQANWIAFSEPDKIIEAQVKTRSNGELVDCKIIPQEGGARIELAKPSFAVTAGQSAVFYLGEIVLGGGIIK